MKAERMEPLITIVMNPEYINRNCSELRREEGGNSEVEKQGILYHYIHPSGVLSHGEAIILPPSHVRRYNYCGLKMPLSLVSQGARLSKSIHMPSPASLSSQ